MSMLSCAQVRNFAPELALGVLGGADRAEVLMHIDRCPACRAHINELSETADALSLLAPEAEPPVGFERRVLHAMGVERHRGWRAAVFSRWAAVAAVAGLLVAGSVVGTLAGLGIIGGHHSRISTEYVQAIEKMGGTSLKAAPMVTPDNKRTGEAFAFQGKRPWVLVTVDYTTMPSGTYEVLLDDTKGPHSVGSITVADGHGMLGAPAPVGGAEANAVRVVDAQNHLMCEAFFSS
ncbi:MAG: zf-HC2 domain-containing protein [Actinobacteria bacterium]|nr:zf-HC2 domain-containing protein [Actinomycetota bacterium]